MAFFSSTALGPHSPLFRGRQAELARLTQLCRDEVSSYIVLYGGRQNGKTSLLLRLEATLRDSAAVCAIDFQLIKGASAGDTFRFLAAQIAQALPLAPEPDQVSDGPALRLYLEQALARPEIARCVLILDEWGALPAPTREALANALRSIFHTRLVRPSLAKLQVAFSGGVELYDLVISEASSLHNICEDVYLADLARPEAVALVTDGLGGLGVPTQVAEMLGAAVYSQVAGHPYLTQKLGGLLERAYHDGTALDAGQVDAAVRQIQRGDPLLRRIRDDLREYKLEDAARHLLKEPPPFTRLDDAMARLELIGLVKPEGERWVPRNALLAEVFCTLLGLPPLDRPVASAGPPDVAPALLRDILVKDFNDSELRDLCFDLNIDYESLPGQGKAGKARELVAFAQRHARTADLAARCRHLRPHADWPTKVVSPTVTPLPGASAVANPPTLPQVTRQPAWAPTLVHVRAGPFLMGSSGADEHAEDNEKPQHRLELSDYWIGKTLITNAQFRPFVEGDGYQNKQYWTATGWEWREQEQLREPYFWDVGRWNGDTQPVVGVNWFEAVAYCRWLSAQTGQEFHLPSEAEWEKAARGPEGRIWPWGNTWEAGRCNSKEAGIGRTTPVEQYPGGASPYGVLDLAGNVWEWCATQWDKSYPYQVEDEWSMAYLDADAGRVVRGGAYYSDQKAVRGAYRISVDHPHYRRNTFGMRVASHSLRPDSGF